MTRFERDRSLSCELDNALRLVADNVCNDRQRDISLYEFMEELGFGANTEAIVEAINRHVAACNSAYTVEIADPKRVSDGVMGPAVYCARVHKHTGQRRYFIIGPYATGMWFAKEASEEAYQKACAYNEQCKRRREQESQGESAVGELCDVLAEKLQQVLAATELTPQQRSDAEEHLKWTHNQGATRMAQIAAACSAAGITLQDLIVQVS